MLRITNPSRQSSREIKTSITIREIVEIIGAEDNRYWNNRCVAISGPIDGHNVSKGINTSGPFCARTPPTSTSNIAAAAATTHPVIFSLAIQSDIIFRYLGFSRPGPREASYNVRPRLREARDNNNSSPGGAQHAELLFQSFGNLHRAP